MEQLVTDLRGCSKQRLKRRSGHMSSAGAAIAGRQTKGNCVGCNRIVENAWTGRATFLQKSCNAKEAASACSCLDMYSCINVRVNLV